MALPLRGRLSAGFPAILGFFCCMHRLHVVPVPVDDEQGEHHQGERQQGAHHDQLVPVRLGVQLLGARLARQHHGLLLRLDARRARPADQGGALLARLRPHAVVGQQLAEALLLRPALVGLRAVGLRHHHQVPLGRGVEELAGGVAVAPLPPGQVGAQLTRQDSEGGAILTSRHSRPVQAQYGSLDNTHSPQLRMTSSEDCSLGCFGPGRGRYRTLRFNSKGALRITLSIRKWSFTKLSTLSGMCKDDLMPICLAWLRPLNALSTCAMVNAHTAELPDAPLYLRTHRRQLSIPPEADGVSSPSNASSLAAVVVFRKPENSCRLSPVGFRTNMSWMMLKGKPSSGREHSSWAFRKVVHFFCSTRSPPLSP
ncbi:hypothetical protein EYF80_039563 [Liparis tanakae]|uniref:Uncharacterized protein n=1 Tax=Liparis tanakae TaxID=230148 RepID=A0A4Z2G9J2_9TELE|nr:hypothetical protein EYF80_039563 [Liparis tanakae]